MSRLVGGPQCVLHRQVEARQLMSAGPTLGWDDHSSIEDGIRLCTPRSGYNSFAYV